jgi:carbamoyl-phosphate synthase large subunit
VRKFRVLLLGGGKRVSLARRFITAGLSEGLDVEILSYDLTETEPICTVGSSLAGLRWGDPGVGSDIKKIVDEREVDLVVSSVDPATVVHAELREAAPAFALSCDRITTKACLSKISFQGLCESAGLPIAPLADGTEFPLFAKPIFGSSSVGAQLVRDRAHMDRLVASDVEYIFQRAISGTEYSIDAYASRDGTVRGISPRTRDVVVGGEVEASTTVHDEQIVKLCQSIISRLALTGPLTIQMIRDSDSQGLHLIEVNPRFGGGVPVSIEAGFDFPLMMIRETLGKDPGVIAQGHRIRMTRYFQEYFHAVDH